MDCRYFRKYLMHRNPDTAETRTPTISGPRMFIVEASVANSSPFKTGAPATTGRERRNEKRAASVREKPRNKAIVMVEPLREVPGMRAAAWAQPMMIAFLNVRSAIGLL